MKMNISLPVEIDIPDCVIEEIRNKAIDDFMNIVEEKADGGYFDVGGYHDVTNDIVGILDKIAEQLKGSVGNEVN